MATILRTEFAEAGVRILSFVEVGVLLGSVLLIVTLRRSAVFGKCCHILVRSWLWWYFSTVIDLCRSSNLWHDLIPCWRCLDWSRSGLV